MTKLRLPSILFLFSLANTFHPILSTQSTSPSYSTPIPGATSLCVPSSVAYNWPSQYVQSGNATIQVIVQGSSSKPAVVIVPSHGRDAGKDFDYYSQALVDGGFFVLRPQPRGTLGSSGPLQNVSLFDMASDVANVIDNLADGRATVLGHAFGHSIVMLVAQLYPEKVPAIIVASAQGQNLPAEISRAPSVAGNLSAPTAERLAALQLAFFAPNHNASVWLEGWYPATQAMQTQAIASVPADFTLTWGTNCTQILQIIAADDPFEPRDQWNALRNMFPQRVTNTVIQDASHALFPEQPQAIVEASLAWLKDHAKDVYSRYGSQGKIG